MAESVLIEELKKKILAAPSKLKLTSIFICTADEIVEALRRRQKYEGLAEKIISGKEIPKITLGDATKEDLAQALEKLNNQGLDQADKKKSVQFNLPNQNQKKATEKPSEVQHSEPTTPKSPKATQEIPAF